MKIIIAVASLFLSVLGADAAVKNYLNGAFLKLPPRYLADVPLEKRKALWSSMTANPDDRRLDNKNGWIHYSSDGGDHESPVGRPTSMFWVKLLPRKGESPLVFVHMSKPFADGSVPAKDQTFVLKQTDDGWKDVTKSVIPKSVDLTAHFRPKRKVAEIEVAPFEKIQTKEGNRPAYDFGAHKMDLVWNGSAFDSRKAKSPKLSADD
ncbi:MAG: hypothetical protein V4584_06995 [Verrucomicrobiota bacterium]